MKHHPLTTGVASFVGSKAARGLAAVTVCIIAVGTVFYHFEEGWSWVDSFYFSSVTLTTVGYGDLFPQSDLSKVFTAIYSLVGIGLLVAYISEVAEHLLATVRSTDRS